MYRTHFTPHQTSPQNKPAKEVALLIFDWLEDHGQLENILVIGGDSTNSMTGWQGGSLALLEKLANEKKFWVVCQIHTNELPLRHLIEKLDGKTTSKDGFSGPIGKKLASINSVQKKLSFEPIPFLEPIVDIPEKIVASMSTDSMLAYRLVKALSIGNLTPELDDMRIAETCYSR